MQDLINNNDDNDAIKYDGNCLSCFICQCKLDTTESYYNDLCNHRICKSCLAAKKRKLVSCKLCESQFSKLYSLDELDCGIECKKFGELLGNSCLTLLIWAI